MTSPAAGRPAAAGRARTGSWRDWYVLALAAGAATFCLGPSLVGARTLLSVNFLTDFLPWSAQGNRSVGHQFCQSDTVDSVMPAIAYTRRQIFSGHLGSWQSISAGGGPMSALPNQGLLDPLSLPYWFLPLRFAPAAVVLLCWVAAIGGTFLFLRRLAVGRAAATLAGFIFATSGFMVMWTNWPQTRTAALIPALFWATDRVATRSKPSDVVLLGAVLASMLFGGFPAVTGYALYAAGAYFVIRVLLVYGRDWRSGAKRAGLAVSGLLLGGALSAVQMLPFADFYRVYNPAFRTSEAKLGLPLGGLATTFAPGTNGLCVVGRSGLPTAYGPTIPVELVAYVGSAALVLAVLGAAFVAASRRWNQRGTRGFFVGACVVIVVVGWASPTAHSIAAKLPVFSNNFVGRVISVLGFGLAVLAGFGFDWLTSRRAGAGSSRSPEGSLDGAGPVASGQAARQPGREAARRPDRAHAIGRTTGRLPTLIKRTAWPATIIVGSLIAGTLVVRASHRNAFAGHYLPAWNRAIWLPLVLLGVSALLAGGASAFLRAGAGANLAFLVLPVLVVAQATAFFHTVMPGDDPNLFYPDTADHRFLAAHLGHDRFASAGLSLYASTAYYYGLRSPTGHQFTDGKWLDLLRAVDPKVMASATNSDFTTDLNQDNVGDQPILDQMGVRYAVLPSAELAGIIHPLPPAAGSVTARSGAVSCTLPGGPIRGVAFRLAGTISAAQPPTNATLHVSVRSGGTVLQSGLYMSQTQIPAATDVAVPLAGEDLRPGTPLDVSIWATGADTPLVLAGNGTQAACSTVAPRADGLRLVFADPAVSIYQRLTALPRIRWASRAVEVAGGAAEISAMQKGIAGSEVLLSTPGPPPGGRSGSNVAGGPASVAVTDDSGDTIAARVDAAAAGYLVVADPMQLPGWAVTVDGRPARLLAADYAMAAVAVPAGRHTIAFTYRAPGELAGSALTGAGLVVSGVLLWWDRSLGRRERARRASSGRRSLWGSPGPERTPNSGNTTPPAGPA